MAIRVEALGLECDEGTQLELINVRLRAIGHTDKPELPTLPSGNPDPSAAQKSSRSAYLPEIDAFTEIDVYDGHLLAPDNVIDGPALIERVDTTIFVSSSFSARVDHHGSYLLSARDE